MNMEVELEKNALNAGASVLSALLSIAGAAAAFVLLSTAAGYAYLFGYFSTLGAPWVLGLLPAQSFLQYGAGWVGIFVLMAWLAMMIYSLGGHRKKRMVFIDLICIALGVSSIVFFLVSDGGSPNFWIPTAASFFLVPIAPRVIIRTAVDFGVGVLGKVRIGFQLSSYLWLCCVLAGIAISSMNRAYPESFSVVVFAEGEKRWLLVTAFGGLMLITSSDPDLLFREYRVVAATDVGSIQTTQSHAPWAPAAE